MAADSNLSEADAHFQEALQGFQGIHARFDVARTRLDLAMLSRRREDQRTAASHAAEARRIFLELALPKHVERTDQLTAQLGLAGA